jgi:hypothetical protein
MKPAIEIERSGPMKPATRSTMPPMKPATSSMKAGDAHRRRLLTACLE